MIFNYISLLSVIFILLIKSRGEAQNSSDSTQTESTDEGSEAGSPGFFSTCHVPEYNDDLANPCNRNCDGETEIKKCYYKFKVEWYITMSKACFDCPFNITDCLRPHCVAADGLEKPIVTVNRRLPGPSIQVCENDEIIVDVINNLNSDSTTVHWHGIHQIGTQYMDGVPSLTQCPINGGNSFRYHFIADPVGTHYWHSHAGFQRADGMFGSLIVRSRNDPHKNLYDVDNSGHVILVTDWMDRLTIDKFVNHHHTEHENKPYNILVNGIGKYKPLQKGNETAYTPLYEFTVKPGLRYRFRSISNSIQNCPMEMSVDNHKLLIIASDGQNLQPLEVETLVIYAGERWDFVINANQKPGVYWVKFKGLLDCDDRYFSAHQVAVFRYEGHSGFPNTPEQVNWDFTTREGLKLNNLNEAPGDQTTFYSVDQIRSPNLTSEPSPYARTPDYKFWLEFDFYGIDNEWFHNHEFYPFYGVENKRRLYLPQINHITFKSPQVPPLSQPMDVNQSAFCNKSSMSYSNCEKEFCHCGHMLNVKLGSLVEIILIDTGVVYYANHPFHLHGQVFAVLGMEGSGTNTTLEAVKTLENSGRLRRNFENPPLKDSVTVPDGGYTVIRFLAKNPGYWLFHCHLTFHVETGMAVVFNVGERKDLPPVPAGFPKCGSWLPKPVYDLHSKIKKYENGSVMLEIPSNNNNEFISYQYLNVENRKSDNPQHGDAVRKTASKILINLILLLITIL